MNCKIENRLWFLAIIFELPLGFNKHKRVAVAVGSNLVCERRYDESRVGTDNNDLIEKNGMVDLLSRVLFGLHQVKK